MPQYFCVILLSICSPSIFSNVDQLEYDHNIKFLISTLSYRDTVFPNNKCHLGALWACQLSKQEYLRISYSFVFVG
jgi:hypothetical protein